LFARVATILEEARGNVVRSVNSNMVLANWLIGREIVAGVQAGEAKAEYGSRVLGQLSERLQSQFGDGFSVSNLENFRRFYLAYQDRRPISYPMGTKLIVAPKPADVPSATGSKLNQPPELPTIRNPSGSNSQDVTKRSYPLGTKSTDEPALALGFAPELTWSHRVMVGVRDSVVSILETAALVQRGYNARLVAARESVASRSQARTWDRSRFRAAATREKAKRLTSLGYGAAVAASDDFVYAARRQLRLVGLSTQWADNWGGLGWKAAGRAR
jgi:hypothetical protein